jgi:CBS domain-containing protein
MEVRAMKAMSTTIGDRGTVTVTRTTHVGDAARLMADKRIGAVPALDGGRLAGIFTEREVLTRVVAAGRDPDATEVGEVMSSALVVAAPDESYETCLSRRRQAHVRHVIVLDRGRLSGIVSLRDLLAVEFLEKAEAIDLLNAYVHDIPASFGPKS